MSDPAKVANKVEAVADKAQHQTVLDPARGAGDDVPEFSATNDTTAEQYPTLGYQVRDPKDAKYELLQDEVAAHLADTGEMGTKYGMPQWSDAVLEWMEKKKQAGIKAQFEKWFMEEFDKMNPTAKALARKLYPTFYADRMRTLELNSNLAKELAAIRLRGVQTKSDLFLQYAADNGMIDLSMLSDLLHPEGQNMVDDADNFKRGLFNPRRRFPGAQNPNRDARRQANQMFYRGDVGVAPVDTTFTEFGKRPHRAGWY